MLISEDVWRRTPPPYKLSRSFSMSSAFPFLSPCPAALICSTISFAYFSAAASLILGFSSTYGAVASSGLASAGGSASAGGASSTFLAAFFLGAGFLPLAAAFPFPLAAGLAAFGFSPLAFAI